MTTTGNSKLRVWCIAMLWCIAALCLLGVSADHAAPQEPGDAEQAPAVDEVSDESLPDSESELLKRLRTASTFSAGPFELVSSAQLEQTESPYFLLPRPGHDEVIVVSGATWARQSGDGFMPEFPGDPILDPAPKQYERWAFGGETAISRIVVNQGAIGNVSPDGRWLTERYAKVDLIDIDTGEQRTLDQFSLAANTSGIAAVLAFSADSKQAYVAYPGSPLTVIDVASGDVQAEYEFAGADFLHLATIPDSSLVVWLNGNGEIVVADIANGEIVQRIFERLEDVDMILRILVVPDGKHVMAVMGVSGQTVMYDVRTGAKQMPFSGPVPFPKMLPAKDVLLTANHALPGFDFLNLRTGETIVSLQTTDKPDEEVAKPIRPITALMLEDGMSLVTIDSGGLLKFWRLRTEDESPLWPWVLGAALLGIVVLVIIWRGRRKRRAGEGDAGAHDVGNAD